VLTQEPAPASADEADQYRRGWAAVLEGLAASLGEKGGET
jgi:hypothetical protein